MVNISSNFVIEDVPHRGQSLSHNDGGSTSSGTLKGRLDKKKMMDMMKTYKNTTLYKKMMEMMKSHVIKTQPCTKPSFSPSRAEVASSSSKICGLRTLSKVGKANNKHFSSNEFGF